MVDTFSDGMINMPESMRQEILDQMAAQCKMTVHGVRVFISPHVALPPKFEEVRVPVPRRGIVRRIKRLVEPPDQVIMIGNGTVVMTPRTAQNLEEGIAQEQFDAVRALLGHRVGEMVDYGITLRWGDK